MTRLQRAFTQHPESVGETYWQHMATALSFAFPLALAAVAALIHSVFPFLCVKTASIRVTQLHDRMVVNRQHQAAPRHKA